MHSVCGDVAGVLRAVAGAEDEAGAAEAAARAKPPSAPNRFAAAVQAALASGLPPAARSGACT